MLFFLFQGFSMFIFAWWNQCFNDELRFVFSSTTTIYLNIEILGKTLVYYLKQRKEKERKNKEKISSLVFHSIIRNIYIWN